MNKDTKSKTIIILIHVFRVIVLIGLLTLLLLSGSCEHNNHYCRPYYEGDLEPTRDHWKVDHPDTTVEYKYRHTYSPTLKRELRM